MYHLPIPIVSSIAGTNNDGVVVGSVNESLLTRAAQNSLLSLNVYAIRRDTSGTSFFFSDVSAAAGNDTPDDFLPFGANAEMSVNDSFFIAADEDIKEIYVDVSTAGAWAGTGLSLWYSTDGISASTQLTAVVDNSNGFRTVGISRISWSQVTNAQAFSPVPGDVTSRKWIQVKLNGFTSATTAPRLRRVWILKKDSTYVDITNDVNGSLSISPSAATFFPLPGSETLYVFNNIAYGLEEYVFAAQANVQTYVNEYLATDDTWKTLPSFTDESSNFTATPSASPTKYRARWEVPSDWTSKSLTLSGITATTGYWIRKRVTTISTLGSTSSPLYRLRAKQFGTANTEGMSLLSDLTIKGVSIRGIGVHSGNQTVLQFVNLTTGASRSFTIPASLVLPLMLDFDDLTITTSQKVGLAHVSGAGTISQLDLYLLV